MVVTDRRARAAIARVVLVVTAFALAISACGEEQRDASTSTPGADRTERDIDMSPFEMPGAGEPGPSTTIPGPGPTLAVPTSVDPATGEVAVLGQKPPSKGGPDPFRIEPDQNTPFTIPKKTTTTTSTTTTTIPPTTTSTTTTIPERFLPPTQSISSVCGLVRSITTVFRPGDDQRALNGVLPAIVANLAAYSSFAPADLKPDVDAIQAVVQRLNGFYQTSGQNPYDPALQGHLGLISAGLPPYQELRVNLLHIGAWESSNC